MSGDDGAVGEVSSATGRPLEIEEILNRLLIHPTSRALVDRLVQTAITPNQVSISSIAAAAAAAVSFVTFPLPWSALAGTICLFCWHVLDGADGDLARRTRRVSPAGELIDGVCDHVSQALIYISLALVLQRSVGIWAWVLALAAAASHTVQANAYEAGRKTYRRWVYGANWMRQAPNHSRTLAGFANTAYLGLANLLSPHEGRVEAAMASAFSQGPAATARARSLYRGRESRLVKQSGLLGSTSRSLLVIASLLLGSPLWFFLYEIVVLNLFLTFVVLWRRKANLEVVSALSGLGAEL